MSPAAPPAAPRWLGVAEIAQRVGLHPQTVYRHMRSGRLGAVQVARCGTWRASQAAVAAWAVGLPPRP